MRIEATDTDPPLLVHSMEGSGLDAQIGGYVRYLSNARCFVIESSPAEDEEATRHVAVWPVGSKPTRRDDRVTGIDVPGFGAVPLDGWLTAGGGYLDPATTSARLPEVPADCLSASGEFALVSEVTEVSERPR
jgi:hypothetical protein